MTSFVCNNVDFISRLKQICISWFTIVKIFQTLSSSFEWFMLIFHCLIISIKRKGGKIFWLTLMFRCVETSQGQSARGNPVRMWAVWILDNHQGPAQTTQDDHTWRHGCLVMKKKKGWYKNIYSTCTIYNTCISAY